MELKGDYKYIDFELKMNQRIQGKFKKHTNLNFNNFIEEYNEELEKAKQNNWLGIYQVLSLLVEKLDIKYTLLQVKDEIFENTTLSYIWLVLGIDGNIANNIHFRFETKSEYQNRISNGILKYDKAIIEVDSKYKVDIEKILDSICSNWRSLIEIRYIEVNVVGIMAETILTGKVTDQFIELTKDSEMSKALGLNKIIEKDK